MATPFSPEDRSEIESGLGYTFADPKLLDQAFRLCFTPPPSPTQDAAGNASSVSGNHPTNELLTVIGAGCICLVLGQEHHDSAEPIGHRIVSSANSCEIRQKAECLDLIGSANMWDRFLAAEYNRHGKVRKRSFLESEEMADLVRAVIGAVWVDSKQNFQVVQRVVQKLQI
ncbi:hypothetical protein K402DRAFT_421701 [Aulographum hederae CBS 113979]|uniref:RNase III domain-containing protein n=1 Tax=Aulographum hederae CBS 113979 TaxID=1176131 RepID=A0A6G1GXT6_9PEZI|nr:hypothetical protein K402DRAFT_421701 [Aulographum hederae CBS 113979]